MAVLLIALMPLTASAAATVSISPGKGPAGTTVTIEGSGYGAGALVTVLWDSVLPMTAKIADSGGSWSTSVTIPAGAANGSHTIAATSVLQTATTRFVVGPGETTTTTTAPTTTLPTTTLPTTTLPTTTVTTPPTTIPGGSTTSTTTPPGTTPTTAPTPGASTSTTVPGTPPTASTIPGVPGTPGTGAPNSEDPDPANPDPTDPDPTIAPGSTTNEPEDQATSSSLDGLAPGGPGEPPIGPEGTLSWTSTASEEPGEPPILTRLALGVDSFELTPQRGPVGAEIEASVTFDDAMGGFSSVVLRLDGEPLGEDATVNGSSLTIRRTVPTVAAGMRVITLTSGTEVLAETRFVVIQTPTPTSNAGAITTLVLVVVALMWLLGRSYAEAAGPLQSQRQRRFWRPVWRDSS